jgi:hypothetical protein
MTGATRAWVVLRTVVATAEEEAARAIVAERSVIACVERLLYMCSVVRDDPIHYRYYIFDF